MGTLTILPTAMSAGDWTRERAADRAVFGYPAVSHSQWVRAVYRAVHPARAWLSEGESLAVVAWVVDEYYAQRPAAPFSGLRHRIGFWRSLQRLLNECRMACLGVEELADVLQAGGDMEVSRPRPPSDRDVGHSGGGVDADRAGLIGDLYAAYDRRLSELNATDASTAESELAGLIRSHADRIPTLADADEIEVRGIYDIKPATFEWILELARHRPTTVFLPLPKDHPRSIRWLEWTYRKFEYLADEAPTGLTVQSEDLQSGRGLAELLPRLFQPLAQLKEQKIPPLAMKTPLRVLEANDSRAEIVEVARRVRRLCDEGTDPARIAVMFRRPDPYPTAPDTFAAFDVPVEISPDLRDAWHPEPLDREALDLVALAAGGFEREDLAGWLGRTRARLPDPLCDPDLGRILREARILRGPPSAIHRRLKEYADSLGDETARALIRSVDKSLQDALGAASSLADPSRPGPYVKALEAALDALGWFGPESPITDGDAPTLRERLRRLERILEGIDRKWDSSVLYDLLSDALSGGGAGESGGVRLLSILDAAAIEIDHLFIVGLTAGAFPSEPKQEVFLKDHEREEISAAYIKQRRESLGPRLAAHRPFDTAKEERLRENFLFFLCLAQPTGSVTLSYPRLDPQGRPATPSPYLDEIFKQFEDPRALFLPAGVGDAGTWGAGGADPAGAVPMTRPEMEAEAVERLGAETTPVTADDADRIRWIATQIDIERRRERFYLERNRERRKELAFEYTGRLAGARTGFWRKADISVGALEAFAGCPFRGFARTLIGLEKIDRPVEGLSFKDLGTLLHRFLEIFWKELDRIHGKDRGDLTAVLKTARSCAPAAFEAAAREMARLGAEGPFWESQKAALRYLIDSIVDLEEDSLKAGLWPSAIERQVTLELSPDRRARPKQLIGRIDRLDRAADGAVRIIDYKLSDVMFLREKKKKLGMTELQLPAYAQAVAAQDGLAGRTPVALVYVSLRHAAQALEIWSGTVDELKLLFQAGPVLESIAGGRFDVTPEDETLCDTCEFRRACRVREVLGAPAEEGGEAE